MVDVDEYDWKMLNMLKGEATTKRTISLITDKKNWKRKQRLDDDFFEDSLKGKI